MSTELVRPLLRIKSRVDAPEAVRRDPEQRADALRSLYDAVVEAADALGVELPHHGLAAQRDALAVRMEEDVALIAELREQVAELLPFARFAAELTRSHMHVHRAVVVLGLSGQTDARSQAVARSGRLLDRIAAGEFGEVSP